jgi:hypothetical protein
MGQKVFKKSSMMTFEGFYPTREEHENCLPESFLKVSTNIGLNTFCTGSFQCCLRQDSVEQSVCEFRDYCNHLYYIDDKCDCASVWKKTTGLVIPISI